MVRSSLSVVYPATARSHLVHRVAPLALNSPNNLCTDAPARPNSFGSVDAVVSRTDRWHKHIHIFNDDKRRSHAARVQLVYSWNVSRASLFMSRRTRLDSSPSYRQLVSERHFDQIPGLNVGRHDVRPSVQMPSVAGVDSKFGCRTSRGYVGHFLKVLTYGDLDVWPFELKIDTPFCFFLRILFSN